MFAECIAGLYRTKHVRLIAIDTVGDIEDDTYTVPTGLFSFRQNEWPATLYFPATRACPSIVPESVLEAVLAFQAATVTKRYAIGDRTAEELNTRDREHLSEVLGVTKGLRSKQTWKQNKKNKKNKSAAGASAAGAGSEAEADYDEDEADFS